MKVEWNDVADAVADARRADAAGEAMWLQKIIIVIANEHVALRKVADAASLLEDAMRDIPCHCRDKACEVMCRALREAGR